MRASWLSRGARPVPMKNVTDYTGRRVKNAVVLRRLEVDSEKRTCEWECACLADEGRCGVIFVVKTDYLGNGTTFRIGCGCAKKSARQRQPAGPMPRLVIPLSKWETSL